MADVPSEAAERLTFLQERADDLGARAAEATARLSEIAERRRNLLANAIYNRGIDAVAAEVQELDAAAPRLQTAIDEAAAANALLSSCKAWANRVADSRILYVAASLPKAERRRGETWQDAVDRVRADIADTRRKIAVTEATPAADNPKEAIADYVRRLGASARPTVRADGHVTDPEQRPTAMAVMCWLMPQTVTKALEVQLPPQTMTPAERDDKLAALKERLREAEWQEEALVRGSETAGEAVVRRADARVQVVLGVQSDGFEMPTEVAA